jgi:hypothetical protein
MVAKTSNADVLWRNNVISGVSQLTLTHFRSLPVVMTPLPAAKKAFQML